LFFGRDGQASAIIERLQRERLVAVVGTSGSGKSSLVRAGLLPMLAGGFMPSASSFWRFAVMRPRNDAIGALAAALADPAVLGKNTTAANQTIRALEAVLRRSSLGLIDAFKQAQLPEHENLLIVVDQFEELFRFQQLASGEHDDTAPAFVRLLIEAGRQREHPIYIALTMRSDFLGECARFRDLPETLNDGQYLIPRLTRDQRRAAIEGPIAVSGATITPRLTQRLLNDAGDDPDALPVLQHALMRTWDAWHETGATDHPIDLEHYLAIGGMAQALDRHADQAYNELGSTEGRQAIAQRMFRSLCEKGTDYREVRRPARLDTLAAVARTDIETMTRVIDAFRTQGRTFLMPGWSTPLAPDTVIDISHESLIRQWRTLREWVQREARSAALYQRLRQTAQLWLQNAAALWRNPDLERALLWEREEQPNVDWAERYGTRDEFSHAMDFLRKSEAAWQEETQRAAEDARLATERELEIRTQREREEKLEAQLSAERSRKRFFSAVSVLIPLLIAGLAWALVNRADARNETRKAQEALQQAKAQAEIAENARQAAEAERARAKTLLERLTNSNRLKQAFLRGEIETIRRIDAATPPDADIRFRGKRTPLSAKTKQGELYVWELSPTPQTLQGPLKAAAQITYYMHHPTFQQPLLSAGPADGFTASYTGWGCLSIVYVLIEFSDADTPPQLTHFDQCEVTP
jgi:hypothetical protein